MKRLLILLVLFATPAAVWAQGATHYVRAGASGNGSDWTNALAILPSTLVRGDTYYVAGGNYGSYTFSGTGARVNVFKATIADHGTDMGWSDLYAAQAVFTALQFSGSTVTLDGRTEYGFKVNRTGQGRAIDFMAVQNVELKYIDISGPGPNFIYTDDGRGINMGNNGNVNGLLVSHVAIHGFETLISSFNASNVIWEYMKLYDNAAGNPDFRHPNVLQAGGNDNIVFRFNDVTKWATEGIMLCPAGRCTSSNWWIYGNLWHDSKATGPYARVLEAQYGPTGPIFLFNNTFVNTWIPVNTANGGSYSSGSIGRNNIYCGNDGGGPGMPSEANNISNNAQCTAVFVNYAGKDYRIKAGSAAAGTGANLSSYCATQPQICLDINGNGRPATGAWDIGPYQVNAAPPPPPPPPGVIITIAPKATGVQVSTTQQFTASVTGSTNTAVAWGATRGSVTATGLYTAPGTAGADTVTVTSNADPSKSDSGTVTVSAAPPPPPPPGCLVTSLNTFQNTPLPVQTSTFTIEYDATPAQQTMDAIWGLSNGPATTYNNMALGIRFANSLIDARNGGSYVAQHTIPFTAGVTYHLRLVVNPAAHTYNAWVKNGANAEIQIAANYAFRTEQATTSRISNWVSTSDQGTQVICNVTLTAAPPPPPPPTLSMSCVNLVCTLTQTNNPSGTGFPVTATGPGGQMATATARVP